MYNGEKYLEHALTRLLQQDFDDFELIITDNASTDRTPEICAAFATQDPRIRYFRNETNIGLAANHNYAFTLSRGQFFKWVSHDDDYPPSMVSRLATALRDAPPTVSMVYSYCAYVDEYGNVEGIDSDGVASDDTRAHRRLARFLERIHMYNSGYGMIRSDMLRKTQLFGLYPGADYVLFAELAMLGSFVEITEPLLRIRRHPGRTHTANKSSKALRDLYVPGSAKKFSPFGFRVRMHLEAIRSAVIVPASLRDKLLCTAIAASTPQIRSFRAFGGRQKQKLLRIWSPELPHS